MPITSPSLLALLRNASSLCSSRSVRHGALYSCAALALGAAVASWVGPSEQPVLRAVEMPPPLINLEAIAQLPPAPPSPPEVEYPLALDMTVKRGDTLTEMLHDSGVPTDEAHQLVRSIRRSFNPKSLSAGQTFSVKLDKRDGEDEPYVESLILPVSLTTTLKVTRGEKDQFRVEQIVAPTQTSLVRLGGKITSSLYQTGTKAGIPPEMLAELIKAYSYDVDFQRDIHPGDRIDVMVERKETQGGVPLSFGNVRYAELTLGKKSIRIYRYADRSGNADYYLASGESVRKALLRTPINGARISSGFGMRTHPILGYSKMHRGVDFAAPEGTPIYAAGDGVVEFAGGKGSYGNYLTIKHTPKYSSAYAHLSRYAKGIRPGAKVRQGQVVAYVGTTGRSTGPHLHYEILANNEQVNPSGVKFKTGNTLAGKELAAFKGYVNNINTQLASLKQNSGKIVIAQAEQKLAKN